jgi:hypothetical protein
LAYRPIHFQDLFKFAINRAQIFTPEAIKKINDLLDISIPNILYNFLEKIKTYPIYQQYALAVVFFLHIEHSYYDKQVFLNFICDGPTPPVTNESIRACWSRWGNTAGRVTNVSHPNNPKVVQRSASSPSREWSRGLSQNSSVRTFSVGNRSK